MPKRPFFYSPKNLGETILQNSNIGPRSDSNEIRSRPRRQDEEDPAGGEDLEKPRIRQRRRKLCNPQLR
jgi:hypothetical protein